MQQELPPGTVVQVIGLTPAELIPVVEWPKPFAVTIPHPHVDSIRCWCEPEVIRQTSEFIEFKHRSHH